MCAAGLKGSLTFEGQQYLAFTGHDDDGITLFRVDSTSARVEWVDTLFDGDAVEAAGAPPRLLDGANQMDVHRVGDQVFLGVTGINDNGFTLFELDLELPPETNPPIL